MEADQARNNMRNAYDDAAKADAARAAESARRRAEDMERELDSARRGRMNAEEMAHKARMDAINSNPYGSTTIVQTPPPNIITQPPPNIITQPTTTIIEQPKPQEGTPLDPNKLVKRKAEIARLREDIPKLKSGEDAKVLSEKFNSLRISFDEEEKNCHELTKLIEDSIKDCLHAGEICDLKTQFANQTVTVAAPAPQPAPPKKYYKKITEKVNYKPNKKPGAKRTTLRSQYYGGPRPKRPPGYGPKRPRPAGARPPGYGPRPRPAGARPPGYGARPAGARPRPR